jgi:endogenous inhibitor of DNA gyrase (YacG/DUF329 family)
MNQNGLNGFQLNLAGIRFWVVTFAVIWLFSAIGLGWLIQSFFILLAFLLLLPIIGFLGLRWWLQRNLVESECPVCGQALTGVNRMQFNCPSCGEPLAVEQGQFQRVAPPGVVDVDAVEVSVRQIED